MPPALLPPTRLSLYLVLVCLHFLKDRFTSTNPGMIFNFISATIKSNENNFFSLWNEIPFGIMKCVSWSHVNTLLVFMFRKKGEKISEEKNKNCFIICLNQPF